MHKNIVKYYLGIVFLLLTASCLGMEQEPRPGSPISFTAVPKDPEQPHTSSSLDLAQPVAPLLMPVAPEIVKRFKEYSFFARTQKLRPLWSALYNETPKDLAYVISMAFEQKEEIIFEFGTQIFAYRLLNARLRNYADYKEPLEKLSSLSELIMQKISRKMMLFTNFLSFVKHYVPGAREASCKTIVPEIMKQPVASVSSCFSADSRYYATVFTQFSPPSSQEPPCITVHLYDITDSKSAIFSKPYEGSDELPSQAFCFNVAGPLLAIGYSTKGIIELWQVVNDNWKNAIVINTGDTIRSLAFNEQGTLLQVNSIGNALYIFDVASGKCIYKFELNSAVQTYFSPDGVSFLLVEPQGVVSFYGPHKETFHKWAIGKLVNVDSEEISIEPCFNNDGNLVALRTPYNTIAIADTKTGKLVQTKEFPVSLATACYRFSPDNNLMVSAVWNNERYFWQVSPRTGKIANTLPILKNFADYECFILSCGTCAVLVSRTNRDCHLYSINDGKIVKTLKEVPELFQTLRSSPDGTICAFTTPSSIAVGYFIDEKTYSYIWNCLAPAQMLLLAECSILLHKKSLLYIKENSDWYAVLQSLEEPLKSFALQFIKIVPDQQQPDCVIA